MEAKRAIIDHSKLARPPLFEKQKPSPPDDVDKDYVPSGLTRKSFPQGFIFGTASSAYQYEGAAFMYGNGMSIWDTFTHKFPDKIADKSNGDVAIDQYHQFKKDVSIMQDMGFDAYRISISWSRILPYGKLSMGVNKEGLKYYRDLIDELTTKGIQPFVTLFHGDFPQYLTDAYDGFLSPSVVDDFRDYADLCFREFGGKVKFWITLNEPHTYSSDMYKVGIYASMKYDPEKWKPNPATMPYLVAHHMLLAHASAVDLYKTKYQANQKGKIGITLSSHWFVPYSSTSNDGQAAKRAVDWIFGWFMDPITYGDYPQIMKSLVGSRLPKFSKEQTEMLKGSYDFLGFNYYSGYYAKDAPEWANKEPDYSTDALVEVTGERGGVPIGQPDAMGILYMYPEGIYEMLRTIKLKYNNPLIYITENGFDEKNNNESPPVEALNDPIRIKFYDTHLSNVLKAIKEDKVDVRGYFPWSLMDNFEWGYGYTVRFGFNYVDFKDGLKRYNKESAKWFKKFLHN